MEQRFKHFFKTVALFFLGFLLFTNCEKQDDTTEQVAQTGYFLTRVGGSEIDNHASLTGKLTELRQAKGALNSYTARYENAQFNLNLNEAAYIESPDGTHSYTFEIYNEDGGYDINNIVLVSRNGQDYEAYLSTYTLTEEERNLLASGVAIDLEGKMSIEPFDINQINTYGRAGGGCFDLVFVRYEDCSCHEVHATGGCTHPNEIYEWQEVACPGTGSGGGGGSGSGTGTGTGGTGGGSTGSGDGTGGTIPTTLVNSDGSSLTVLQLQQIIETPYDYDESVVSLTNRIKSIGEYFQRTSHVQFRSLNEMLTDALSSPDLSWEDLDFIWLKTKEAYDILNPYNAQIAALPSLDDLDLILPQQQIAQVESNLISVALLPELKDLFNGYWPQNAEEWAEFGEFLVTVLLEIVPELIPGVAEIVALKNAIENFSSNEYLAGTGELVSALIGIFPVGKAIKAINKVAKGVRIVVRLTKSFKKAKRMVSAISNSLDEALPFWNSIGYRGDQNYVRILNNASEKQGRSYYDLLTKNRVGNEIVTNPFPNDPTKYIRRSTMPDGSTIQIRNYSTQSSSNATIDFAGGNYNSFEIRELKFID